MCKIGILFKSKCIYLFMLSILPGHFCSSISVVIATVEACSAVEIASLHGGDGRNWKMVLPEQQCRRPQNSNANLSGNFRPRSS
ncbi:hypothetical protein L1987_13947 [Smallanthus sonchifolius]|uniref:Uncharacterized protein n=1 Tax=Smallanthus sonchifolius TaxID=185202 RepID=A0ACB9JHX9_9ASTR|nr:hypothetical protein L1987_13947 [Smallanthus sonchifolius]